MIRSLVEAPSLAGVRICHSSLPRISSERFGRGGKSGAMGGEGLRTFRTPGKVAGEEQSTLIPQEGPGLGNLAISGKDSHLPQAHELLNGLSRTWQWGPKETYILKHKP